MIALLFILTFSHARCTITTDFPDSIPIFRVRIDSLSKQPVTSGHLHSLKSKMTLNDFKQRLQCSESEPDFDYNSGSISLLRSIPPTREIVELMCAYGENRCRPWSRCREDRDKYLSNSDSIPKRLFSDGYTIFNSLKMFRVMDGQLYYDWPWGIDRWKYREDDNFMETNQVVPLMKLVLDIVSDIPDSVFFAGVEDPSLPVDYPFPMFTMATSMTHADMPWPWMESFKAARNLYHSIQRNSGSFVHDDAAVEKFRSHWKTKQTKCAFFGSYDEGRAIMYDAARRHPDLFDAAFGFPMRGIRSWNPLSRLDVFTDAMKSNTSKKEISDAALWNVSGYALPLVSITHDRPYDPLQYKYVVVPMGSNSLSTSGRLAGLLATSGAVVLLQRTPLAYHFSARLKPWVHYVPLTYSGADLAEKVEWLVSHDDMARQIAENGRAFARSYLRLEDYYCYAASALEVVGEIERGSDALQPFNAKPIGPIHTINGRTYRHVNASEIEED